MNRKIPRLLLFDIDGTLVVSRHKKINQEYSSYLLESLSIAFGQEIKRNEVQFAGGTDPSITKDLLTSCNINEENCENYHKKVKHAFSLLYDTAKKGVDEGRYLWKILPNVNELLHMLSKRNDVSIGLLTGNVRQISFLKLETAGVDTRYFLNDSAEGVHGAFGSDHGDRRELVQIAKRRYCKYLGLNDIDPNDMVVIGDTPKDILCAHANDTPCVAVPTGVHTSEQLQEADYVLKNGFKDLEESVRALTETQKIGK